MSSTHRSGGTIPAICGAAQVIQPAGELDDHRRGPIELMVDSARAAADDAGSSALLERVDWVGVARGWFTYADPGRMIAERIGSPSAATALTPVSGSAPQELVGIAATRVAAGDIEVALVVGGEARWSRQRLKRAGRPLPWLADDGVGEPEHLSGFPEEMVSEMASLGGAATSYAIFDDRRRVEMGRSISEHRDHVAALWERFNRVAVDNPFAWDRTRFRFDEIREPSGDNRMIVFPYTKAMVANNNVDMASAVIICGIDTARSSGLDLDRLVFPQVVTKSHETWRVAERSELHRSPALETAGRVAFEHAGIGPADVRHVDLYACFPSVVQMSSEALGFDIERPLTVTGGLGFAGAPVGNAAGQSIAAMVPLVREGGHGLVHANGGSATKHAIGIYSNRPPVRYEMIDVQPEVDLGARTTTPLHAGRVTIEAATVAFDRSGPSRVIAAVITPTGSRAWAHSSDADAVESALLDGLATIECSRASDGELQL